MTPDVPHLHQNKRDVADVYDVPPWLVDPEYPRPRFDRLRWVLRRWWRLP